MKQNNRPQLFVCLYVINLFEQVEVLAAIRLMWTCYTHPPIYTQRTATTPGTSSPTFLERDRFEKINDKNAEKT